MANSTAAMDGPTAPPTTSTRVRPAAHRRWPVTGERGTAKPSTTTAPTLTRHHFAA